MVIQKCDIQFTVINEEEAYTVETYTGEYKNLMSLISDKVYVENFGECGGMGHHTASEHMYPVLCFNAICSSTFIPSLKLSVSI